ncbi:MAG: hypothetical protein N4A57_17200 [Anaeromicrobium sp.]|jgi:hypothetical protein|uniref:hypothetical protein n=1 Tax=Anaeromicrobium sp. TaxID=1929132 RepID=UPI0025F4975B|nr:hypothetical protein [Anaeromicrobium sp.]MCT4595986.1 hypothetical protein [Anaeromicrobium sp.]
MQDFFGIVEAFYSRFILRDLLAKVVPGALLMMIVFQRIIPVEIMIDNMSFILGVLFISVSWIVGFAIQGIGEKCKLIKYHVDDHARDRYVILLKQSALQNNKDIERVVVIKEACGNTYVSLLIISIFIILKYLSKYIFNISLNMLIDLIMDLIYLGPEVIVFITLLLALRYMHFEHVKRQNTLIESFLSERGNQS